MIVTKTFTVEKRGESLPDYAAPKTVGQVSVGPIHTSTDIGELAARLGSPITYDRRGNVVWYDNFEEPVTGWHISAFVDAYGRLDSTHFRSGCQSMKLHTEDAAGAMVSMELRAQILGSKRLGLEFSFSRSGHNCDLRADYYVYDGTTAFAVRFKLAAEDEKIYVWDGDTGTWIEVADTKGLVAWGYNIYTIKLVFDLDTSMYERLLFRNAEWNISNQPIYSYESDAPPEFRVRIWNQNYSDDGGDIWIDDVILTQNEP